MSAALELGAQQSEDAFSSKSVSAQGKNRKKKKATFSGQIVDLEQLALFGGPLVTRTT